MKRFHRDCQARAYSLGKTWFCTICARRKRLASSSPTSNRDYDSDERFPKRRKTSQQSSGKEAFALNGTLAVTPQDPQMGNPVRDARDVSGSVLLGFYQLSDGSPVAIDTKEERQSLNAATVQPGQVLKSERELQLSALLSGVSKELSPPYSPQQMPTYPRIHHSTSDAGTQVNLDKLANASADLQPKVDSDGDGSLCGIPLGNEAVFIDNYVPTQRFPCTICGQRVIRSHVVTTCSACMNEDIPAETNESSRQTTSPDKAGPLSRTPHGLSKPSKVTIDIISYGSDDGEQYPEEDLLDNDLAEPLHDPNGNEEPSERSSPKEELLEPDAYDETMEEDPEHPYLNVLHWQQDLKVGGDENEFEFTARYAYDQLLNAKCMLSAGQISRKQYHTTVDDVRRNLQEPLLFSLLASRANKDTSERGGPDEKEEPHQEHFASVSDRGRKEPSVPEELLLKCVQDSNQEVEDLKIRIRHMENDTVASKKDHQKMLKERDEKIDRLNENLETSKRIGQRKIHDLETRNKELQQKQKGREPADLSWQRPAHHDQSYHQLQQEFHAIRRDRSDWLMEKRKLEEEIQRANGTILRLKDKNDNKTVRMETLEKEHEDLKAELGDMRNQQTTMQTRAEGMLAEKYTMLIAENSRLQRTHAELNAQLQQSRDQASHLRKQNLENTSRIYPNDSHTRALSPVPNPIDFKPVTHRDILSGLPLCYEAIDPDSKRAEIASRPRTKYDRFISTQTRKERGVNIHTEPLRWIPEACRNRSPPKRLLAVAVPRGSLSSEERSSYSSHIFGDDEEDKGSVDSDTIRVANPYKFPEPEPKSRRPKLKPRERSPDSAEESSADDSYSEPEDAVSSTEPSASSSIGRRPTFDPVDLSTRGAPLRSSLGQPQPTRTAKPRIIKEDPDASPLRYSNHNEKVMDTLRRAMGVPDEFRPVVRKGKLFMEEVRSEEVQTGDGAGEGGAGRPKRTRGWAVGD